MDIELRDEIVETTTTICEVTMDALLEELKAKGCITHSQFDEIVNHNITRYYK